MEPAARYPRSLRRVIAAATTLAVSTAVVAVPEVPGVGLQRAEAQQAIQLQPELSNANVRNNGSTWEATVFFAKPMEVRSVTFDFVPPSSTGANNSRNDSAGDDDPILNVIPLEDTYNVVHYKLGNNRPVATYRVTGFKSLGKSPSNRNTIRLTYELPAGTQVGQSDRLVLEAPGKVGVFPTPYLGDSRFTNAWVNGGAVAGSVDGLPEGASVTVSMVNADRKVVRKQDGVRGAYQIPDVQPGNYTMRVSGWEGYSFSPVNGVPVSVEMNAQETANFTFSRDGGVVAGSVDGLPEGATVTVSVVNAAGDVVDKRDGVRGVYEIDGLDPGDYTVRVSGWKGYSSSPVEGVPVSVKKNVRETANFNFSRDAGVVAGFVDGLPEGASVTVRVVDASGREVGKQVGVRGTYRIPGVPTGDHTVRVSGWKGYSSSPVDGVPVSVKKNVRETANFNFSRDERAVSGEVRDLPADKIATVRLVGADGQTQGQQFNKAVNGSFAFNDVPTGTYDVKVDDLAGYSFTAPAQVTVGTNGNTPESVEVTAKRDTGSLVVYVPGDVPVDVRVQGPDNIDHTFKSVTESFSWPERPTGVYRVTVTDPQGYSVRLAQGSSNPVEVKKDQTASVKFAADRVKRSVSGRVANLPAGKTVTVRLVGADAQTRGTEYKAEGVNGSFAIRDVPTGTYDVKVDDLAGYSFAAPSQVMVGANGNTPASLNVNAVRDVYSFGGSVANAPAGTDMKVRLSAAGEATREVSVRDGKFSFTDVPTAKYSIQLIGAPQGYSVSGPSSVNVSKTGVDPQQVNYTLSEDAGSITGKVVDQAGKRVEGAKATLKTRDGKVVRDLPINTAGEIKVTDVVPGQYTVVVELPEKFDAPASQDIEIRPGGSVSLKPVPVVRSVYSFAGTVANAPAGVNLKVRLSAAGEATREVSVRDGKFSFTDVPTAKYSIQLVGAPQGYAVTGPSSVDVTKTGVDPQTPTFELTANPAKVTGTVTDGENKPLPGTVVEFKQGDEVVRELVADEQGVVRDEAFPPGDYTVVVTPPTGYEAPEPVDVTVNPGEDFELDVPTVVRSTGSVVGEVVGAPDRVELTARLTLEGETPREATVTGGEFKFDRIPTGSYKFELLGVPTGFAVSGLKPVVVEKDATATPKVTVSADAVTVTGSFTGEGNKPLPGTKVEFKQGDEVVRELVSDAQGKVRDEAFPPGEYTVVVTPPTGYEAPKPVEVTVKPGKDLELGTVEIASSEADDSFSWDNLRVAPGEVKVVTPDHSAEATAEVTFQTEKITQPDGTEVTVAPGQSWLEIESDGTVVARPPADTAPGTYQLEVVASTGERDTVTVEVSPAPSMKDRYKVDSQAVEVPAGSERRSSKPRASVREGAFTHANQPLPNDTTFRVNHKGASVDALGRVTFTPDANAKPGPVRIPVSVTFPDESTATFDVVFNVGEPLLATQYPLTYPATANAPHKRTTAVQAMGQVPEGTRFALADDVELGDWFVSVDSVTGRLRAIPPSENAAPAEVKVVAYFTDGSTSELTTTLVAQKADFNVGGKTGLTYGSTVTQIGEQTTLKPQGPVKPGTRFAIDETFAKNGWDPRIDPVTGAITVRTDDTVPAGEQVLLPVVVALPDGSLETVEVPLRAVDKQKPSDGRTRAETTGGSSTSDWVVVLIGALVAIGGLTVALAMNEREVRRVLEKYGITW